MITEIKTKLKKNKRERLVQEEALANGYEVLFRGWPDFLLYKESTNEVKFIEVKRKAKEKTFYGGLGRNQRRVIKILKNLGFDVEVRYVD